MAAPGSRIAILSTKKALPREVAACVPVGGNSSLGPANDDMDYLFNLVDDPEFYSLMIPELIEVSEHDYVSDLPDHLGNEDEFDRFYRVLSKKATTLFGQFPPTKPLAVSDEEKAVQEKFKEMANKCIDLLVDTMRRISPLEKKRKLFPIFGELYPVFVSMRWAAEAGRAEWCMALYMIEELEVMRKMVSSACGTGPLPYCSKSSSEKMKMASDWSEALTTVGCDGVASRGVGVSVGIDGKSNLPVVIFVLIASVYCTVKSDIDSMISPSTAP